MCANILLNTQKNKHTNFQFFQALLVKRLGTIQDVTEFKNKRSYIISRFLIKSQVDMKVSKYFPVIV